MKNRLLVVTDLGTFKAYRIRKDDFSSSPRLELVEGFDTEAEEKLSDHVTDQAGRFGRGGASPVAGELSNGERHNIVLEQERRVARKLADKLTQLLRPAEVDGCFFAANAELNHKIIEHLAPGIRAKIEKNVNANLTKIDKGELLRHF